MNLKTWAAAALGMLAGCASSDSGTASNSGKRVDTDYSRLADVIYTPPGWPKDLPADLYQPTGGGPWPAVLLIYGGGWASADHRWQMRALARKLARRGYFVMNASYRGTPEFRYPAPVDDLREALVWLRAHKAEYRLNGKVATYGYSAGGHLATLLGTLDGPPEVRVQAVVGVSAPTDLTLYPGGDILPRFLGTTYQANPKLYRDASPVAHVAPGDPPVFLYHGTADKTVSPEHARVFKAALDRAGVRNQLFWVEGRGHGTMLWFNGAAEAAAIAFLDGTLR